MQDEDKGRAQLLAEVAQSRERYSTLLNSIDGIVWEVDVQTFQFTFVSQQAERLLGYPVAQWITEPNFWENHMHPEDRKWAVDFCLTATTEKRLHQFDYRMLAADGRVVWLRDRVAVITENDRPVTLRGIMIDVTAQKHAEQALRESEERYRQLVETANDVIYRTDDAGHFTYANPVAARLMHCSVDNLIGLHYLALVHPDYREETAQFYRKQYLEEIPNTYYEFPAISIEGREVWVGQQVQLLKEQDRVVGFQAVARDITDRKQAEAALQESEARWQFALEGSGDGVWDWNVQTSTLFFSSRWKAMLGYAEHEIGDHLSEWDSRLHPDDRERTYAEITAHFLGETPHYESEYRMLCKDGSYKWILDRGKVLTWTPEGKPLRMVGTHSDITDRIRAEEERRQLQAQLFQAQKLEAIGTLSGGIAHDFNNILAVITGFAELAVDEVPVGSEAHRNLQQILVATRRAATVVRQLLDFSRTTVHEEQEVELSRVIEETLVLLRAMIPASIQLRIHLACQDTLVWGNPTQLQQVLLNLCVNGAHAIGEDGGSIEIGVQKEQENHQGLPPLLGAGSYLHLTIRDTGSGMPPEVVERIFEPFFTTKPVGEGSGLGLAVVHGIVTNHGGTLFVQSKPGGGTSVHIYLPQRRRGSLQ